MSNIPGLPISHPAPELSLPATPVGRGPNAAREFEAHLIGTLLESLEKTFATVPGDPGMAGSDNYNYLGSEALAQGLSAKGGFGIAAMISRGLAAHESKR